MITNVNTLISQCTLELQDRQYPPSRIKKINSHWKTFSEWMLESHTEIFTEDLANEYCDLYLGTHLIVSEMTSENKLILRSIRMLVSYQKDGEF